MLGLQCELNCTGRLTPCNRSLATFNGHPDQPSPAFHSVMLSGPPMSNAQINASPGWAGGVVCDSWTADKVWLIHPAHLFRQKNHGSQRDFVHRMLQEYYRVSVLCGNIILAEDARSRRSVLGKRPLSEVTQ